MVRFLLLILLSTLSLGVCAQTKKASSSVKTLAHRPVNLHPIKQWWWGYSGREVRQQVLAEAGWHPANPSDSCTFCTAFTDGFSCRIEFSFRPDGLWRRTWKIPRDTEMAKQWDAWLQSLPPLTFEGATANQRKLDQVGDYSTWIWRNECEDFIIYTAVGQDEGGAIFGPGFTRFRPLKDCKGKEVY